MSEEIWPKSARSAWQIREFPNALRKAVTEQAHAETVTVTELMTRLVVAARDAEWSSTAFSNPVGPRVVDGFENNQTLDRDRLASAMAMLGEMGRAGIPVQKGVAFLANRLVKRELASIDGRRAPRQIGGSQAAQIEAPSPPSEDS